MQGMVTCKGCGQELITSARSGRCVYCGRKANLFRAAAGTQTFTQRGAVKKARRAIREQAERISVTASVHIQKSPPDPLGGMTWQEAEVAACNWMRLHGYWGARLTPKGADGGIDIVSPVAIAQVKHHAKPVGLGEMQRIHGIARSVHKRALFFSFAGFSPKAREWARAHRIKMYRYPPFRKVD